MTLPFALSPAAAAFLAAAVFVAAFVRGYTGFGFSALVVAFAALIINPVLIVPVVVLAEIAMTVVQSREIRAAVDWRRVMPMLAGAALAMPFSVMLLARVGTDTARFLISGFILAMSLVLMTGWSFRREVGRSGHVGVGLVSGVANGAAVGGLPVAAFMASQAIPARVFRATMVAYLTAIDLFVLPVMWLNGLVSADTFVTFFLSLPLLALGVWLGGRHFLSTSPQSFRRVAILLLFALASLGLLKSVI